MTRHLRISVRELFLLVALIATGMTWYVEHRWYWKNLDFFYKAQRDCDERHVDLIDSNRTLMRSLSEQTQAILELRAKLMDREESWSKAEVITIQEAP